MSETGQTSQDQPSRQNHYRWIPPAWVHPFLGIFYFATHRYLWPLLGARLIPCFVLSLITLVLLFIWTYIPQALLLLPFHGRAAFFNAAILVLGEGATITALLFEAFFVDPSLADVFDAVVVAHGHATLVSNGREIHPPIDPEDATAQRNPTQQLGATYFTPVYSPFSCKQVCEFLLLLPLNFVPWIGVPAFLFLTGARGGPLHHHRYFRLRGLSRKERRRAIRAHRPAYTGFGTAALVLQLVPGLSMLFLLTTAAGSALWAARLEEQRHTIARRVHRAETSARQRENATVPGLEGTYDTFSRSPNF